MTIQNEPSGPGTEQSRGAKQAVSDQKRESKSVFYYFGIFSTLIGSGLILGGLFSDRWVVLSEARHDSVSTDIRLRLTSHFGPWKACRYDGRCGNPWDIVAGVETLDIKWIQMLISITAVLLLGGVVTLCLKCWHLFFLRTHWFIVRFNKYAVAESLTCIATMLTIMITFIMGQMKRGVILRHHQIEHTGYSFLITLIGVLLVAFGIMLMIFSSSPVVHTLLPDPSLQIARWLDNIRRLRQPKTKTAQASTEVAQQSTSPGSNSSSSRATAIVCIAPLANTYPKEEPHAAQNGTKRVVEVIEISSDSQRPEDDFLLINTRSLVEPGGERSAPSISAVQPDLQCDEGETMGYEFDGRSSLQFNVNDLPADVGESEGKTDDNTTVRAEVPAQGAGDKGSIGSGGAEPEMSAEKTSQRTSAVGKSNISNILQTAKRCASDTFARPFQSSDKKNDGDGNASYPGNSGIAVLKYVDV